MTYEEAIKHLQNLKFKFMDEYVDYDNTAEAFQHGIEALKKQIPRKLIEAYCPSCHAIAGRGYDYCWHCGQALDWSDEN